MLYCELNGHQTESISVADRGLAYGDGFFTTAKIEQGIVCHWQVHLKRLLFTAEKLKFPVSCHTEIEQAMSRLKDIALNYPLAVAKVQVTAGQGGRGYSRLGTNGLNILISLFEFPHHYSTWQLSGICLGVAKTRLGINPQLAGLKHLNRLEQVLLRQELDESSYDDLLVTNFFGSIVEASAANVFWCDKDNSWLTPKLDNSGVSGIARELILAAQPDIELVEVGVDALENIEAMFICNSVMGIIPVSQFNQRALNLQPVKEMQQLLCI